MRPFSSLLLCLSLMFPGVLPTAAATGPEPGSVPPQGATLLKTDLLGVFAHPDDETGMAAALAHYALGQGKTVAHAYVTRGEGGGNMVGTQAGPALGVLREVELRECLRILGIRSCFFLDQEDFFYTESLAATLRKWRREEALEKLVRLVRCLRPEVILTMSPAPQPGQHGHHQAAGVLATEAFAAAADPTRFPNQLRQEGLSVWQARKLLFGGGTGPHVTTLSVTEPLPDGRIPADVAGEALSHHRSQAFGGMFRSPWLRRPATFTLVKSVVAPRTGDTDLFSGLPVAEPLAPVTWSTPLEEPPFAFVPRPAIVAFRHWAAEQDIRHLAARFPADLPVVAGERNAVLVEFQPGALPALEGPLQFEAPAGWKTGRPILLRDAGFGSLARMQVDVVPPPDTLDDVEWVARGRLRGSEVTARARLHPVPQARVPRIRRERPSMDGSEAGWDTAARLDIGTNRTWQGKADSAADISAKVRVAHDGRTLFVDIDVADDVVVSNIAPDDIKGHWRSDSVEICLDPRAGSEDTTGCFKVGIFPFDTTGRVRASRDADARPGPVEETAPGLRLASQKREGGYRVQAAIPFELVTHRGRIPRRLGLNVLIYDGDKATAAPGENINECRLAWAPRSGVQGRPEDWGRIDLE